MKLKRRTFLKLTAGAAGLPLSGLSAVAANYPNRPVRFIVGQAAGSGSDIFSRLVAQSLSERLHQPFVVENRPGATGNIATEAVAKSAPDGYTLLFANNSNTTNSTLYKHLEFNFSRDFMPVAGILSVPLVMEINPGVPAQTLPEFISFAKANPGKLTLASAGTGSTSHMCGELFMYMTNTKLLHVPYRGTSPALADLMAGQVQVMFDVIASSQEYVSGGKLRALAVTTETRSNVFPNVPAISEFVEGYDASAWGGMCAPNGVPKEIVGMLNDEVNACLQDPQVKARFAEIGAGVMPGPPEKFAEFLRADTEKWGKVIEHSGLKIEE